MLPISVNTLLDSTTSLGGSSIFKPMTKIHAVGQIMCINIYIRVYMHAEIFLESKKKILRKC